MMPLNVVLNANAMLNAASVIVASPSLREKRVNQRVRKLMQLGRDDERQEKEDRDADGQRVVRG